MIWAHVLKGSTRLSIAELTQSEFDTIHVSKAILGPDSQGKLTLISIINQKEIYLVQLQKDKLQQESLDLFFKLDQKVQLRVEGSGEIHLSGYTLNSKQVNQISEGVDPIEAHSAIKEKEEESKEKPKEQPSQQRLMWNMITSYYMSIDYTPQSFYFPLLNMLEIEKSKNIIDVGCGSCRMMPILMKMKSRECSYTGVQLSDEMLYSAYCRVKDIINNGINSGYTEQDLLEELGSSSQKLQEEYHFPKERISLLQRNGQNLAEIPSDSCDTYISNLVLMLAESPDNFIKECYRVLQVGGKAGFTVAGRLENLYHIALLNQVLKQLQIEIQPMPISFQLGERDYLIKKFQEFGFQNPICWYTSNPFRNQTKEDFEHFYENPQMSLRFASYSPQLRAQIKEEYVNELMQLVNEQKSPILMESLQIIIEQ